MPFRWWLRCWLSTTSLIYRKATRGACAGYLPRILNTDAYADAREHRPGRIILGADLHLAGLQRCRRGIGSVPDRKKHLAIISVTVHLMLWRLAPVHRSDPILCVHGRLAARARLGGFLQCSQGDLLRPVWVAKIFRFRRRANQFYQLAPSRSERGALAIVTDVGTGCGGRGSVGRACFRGAVSVSDYATRRTNDANVYGKTVWSWHPLLVSSWRRFFEPNRVFD